MFSVTQLCQWIGGRVVNGDALGLELERIRVERPAPLGKSKSAEVAYFFAKAYQSELATARPGVLITGEPFVKPLEAARLPLWKTSAIVACADPYLAMAVLSEKFAPQLSTVVHNRAEVDAEAAETFGAPQIHSTAVVDPTAELGSGVQVGAHVVISEHARIGAGSVIYPGVFVGPYAEVGEGCVLFPHVTLYERVRLGNDVRVHAGSVLGADGFGYAPKTRPGPEGKPEVFGHQKIYHLGNVVVGDRVEIGALSSIDRGTIDDTVVCDDVKIDNRVHLGHNTHIGEGAVLCGGVGLAGNASIGKWAYVGGMVGVSNGVYVGDGAKVGAGTIATKDVEPGTTVVGNPQRNFTEHFRAHATLNRMIKKKGEGK